MGTLHDEEEVSSETARLIYVPQEKQVEKNAPLLSNEDILAELGYEMGSSPHKDRDQRSNRHGQK